MPSHLTYAIAEAVLFGRAAGKWWHLHAVSGGAAGSTRGPRASGRDWTANWPYGTWQKMQSGKEHVHGGPIPVNVYRIHRPIRRKRFGFSSYLEPRYPRLMMGRDEFLIHGRGPHGSDGCIVLMERRRELMDALDRDGGGVLHVVDSAMGSGFA